MGGQRLLALTALVAPLQAVEHVNGTLHRIVGTARKERHDGIALVACCGVLMADRFIPITRVSGLRHTG